MSLSHIEEWFLSPEERGNPDTGIDRSRGSAAWTDHNEVTPLVDGAAYFARLQEELRSVGAGDRVWFFDWRGDGDERLVGPATELGPTMEAAVRRGVDVRGLVWRSHPDQEKFSEQQNLHLARMLNSAGGEVLLDERVRRFGSHHQKLVLVRRREAVGDAEPVKPWLVWWALPLNRLAIDPDGRPRNLHRSYAY